MECPVCDNEMVRDEIVIDYNDPGDKDGHSQYQKSIWFCEECSHIEPCIE